MPTCRHTDLFADCDPMAPDTLALYRAGLARDEKEVARLLDEHRQAHGEPEQIAYAQRHPLPEDGALEEFPYATG